MRANLRIRVTKIIARIKSDYFTVHHMDVRDERSEEEREEEGGKRAGEECRMEEREISL